MSAAVFDFDGTLIFGDAWFPWLAGVAGRARAGRALAASLVRACRPGGGPDYATRLKAGLAERLLAGVPVGAALAAADRLVPRLSWRDDLVAALLSHRAAGHRVVIATGSPRLLVERLIAPRLGDVAVLGTELEVLEGVLTGRLAGANAVRREKARRVAAWLCPGEESWGYGNRPADLPMLALVTHARIV